MIEDARCVGHLKTGETVYEYTLYSEVGITLRAMNYGGIITAIEVPDKNGVARNVVLSLDSLAAYEDNPNYIGVMVGRYAGRMKAALNLGNNSYTLDQNDRGNCLHGGHAGFGKKLWRAEVTRHTDAQTLHLKYLSPAGEGGFPGNFMAHVSYRLDRDGTISLIYRGISDEDTAVTMTHHNYFNLGSQTGDVLKHVLTLKANAIGLLDENQLHQFNWESIDNEALKSEAGITIESLNAWLAKHYNAERGLDHPFRLEKDQCHTLKCEESGIGLEVTTDEDYMVMYAGGYIDEAVPMKDPLTKRAFSGLCFETQNLPNGPNHEPPIGVLERGEFYHHATTLKFKW